MLKLQEEHTTGIRKRIKTCQPSVHSRFYLYILATVFLILTLGVYSRSYHPVDLGVYLSAASCFFENGNAWDPAQLTAVAHQRGFLPDSIPALGLWTPPIVFPVLYPFSKIDFEFARILWLLFTVILICSSLALLKNLYPHLSIRRLTLQALLFPPFLALLVWGQISALILTGFLLFLYFESRHWDFLAGIALLLVLCKPHTGFLFWIYLTIFIVSGHRWMIAAGFAGALACVIGTLAMLQPESLVYYIEGIKHPPLQYDASTLFGVIHKRMFPTYPITQFGGVLIAAPIYLFHLCARARPLPKPRTTVPTILLVSQVLAPYGWLYDQVVIFPVFALFAEQLFGRYKISVVWAFLSSLALAYYALIIPEWGNNDWRPMMFSCALVTLYGGFHCIAGGNRTGLHESA